MAAILPPYTETNLPEGFRYDPRSREIITPIEHRFAILNLDNTVSCGSGVYANIHDFVINQIIAFENQRFAKVVEKKQLSREIRFKNQKTEEEKKKYITIDCLDCTINKDSLVILSILIAAFFIGLFLTIALCKYYL